MFIHVVELKALLLMFLPFGLSFDAYACMYTYSQKQSLEGMADFTVPSPDEFNPDNLNRSPLTPRRIAAPQPPYSHKSKTLPGNKRSKSMSGSKKSSVLDTPLPPPPSEPFDSPRASIISNDSGIGVSGGGEIHLPPNKRLGASSVPSSGDAQFGQRGYGAGSSKSDGGKFGRNQIQVCVCVLRQ